MSNKLYMTTEQFAEMVVNILDEQKYFKKGEIAHPEDIAAAFSTVAETIGSAMSWAIGQEAKVSLGKKQAMMNSKDLKK